MIGAVTMPNPAKGLRGYSAPFVQAIREGNLREPVALFSSLCVDRAVSVGTVASLLGVTRPTVYAWFTGRAVPRAKHRAAIETLIAQWAGEIDA
jgi:hypothetical protein